MPVQQKPAKPAKPGKSVKVKKAVAAGAWEYVLVAAALAALSAAAVAFFYSNGYLQYFGDAEAHLNIARRMVDSRTPGWKQIGTVWLPLPHLLMAPFVRIDSLWRSGLAASIPSGVCFVLMGTLLYGAARQLFGVRPAAIAAVALVALNPNLLYLQSTSMTEPVFFAAVAGLLYFTLRFRATGSWGALLGAAVSCLCGTLVRYEGWFLIPFATVYVLIAAKRRRVLSAIVFGAIASAGPVWWLAHNWWFWGDALEFYRGPYSAIAIQGGSRYPGDHDWAKAWLQFRSAGALAAGAPLCWIGLGGIIAALFRKAFWPLLLFALLPAFYVWSMHSTSGTPIYVPHLWPFSYYNTRYGLVALPGLAFCAAALSAVAPVRLRVYVAALLIAAGVSPWVAYPRPQNWVCWKESQVNSEGRRAFTREAAEFMAAAYRPGEGILTSFSDLMGIYRAAGIPLRETLFEDNELTWNAAVGRPDLFLREKWAICYAGDKIATALQRAGRTGPRFVCVRTIAHKSIAQVVEIYRREK